MEAHDLAVAAIAAQVRQFYDRQEPYRIYHGTTNSTRPSSVRRGQMVDTSRLTHVLKVKTSTKTALVEPNVPMDRLVADTQLYGLIPPVVMEFPGITTGGGFSGTSGESSSFRYGFFDRTVNWVEMVLANGETVRASRTMLPDLFYGAASAFGTVGVVTLLELRLVDAMPFVELTYHPAKSVAEAVQKLEEAASDTETDYIDGIVFAPDRAVVCTGRLVDAPSPGVPTQCFTRAHDPWFYLHAEQAIRAPTPQQQPTSPGQPTPDQPTPSPVVEAVPLTDYLFRYDRGGFWVGRYAFRYFVTPFTRATRWLLDGFMRTRVMYHALHASGHANRYIIQDVAVPFPAAVEFASFLHADFGHYPLWLCPLKQTGLTDTDTDADIDADADTYGPLAERRKKAADAPDMLLNFGVWGPGPPRRDAFVAANRRLEQKVDSLGGRKWLYAHAYYTEDEFWSIYDRPAYDALREKYHASHLPSIYDKVRVDVDAEERARNEAWWGWWLFACLWSVWPISGLYGVLMAVIGGDYLLPRGRKGKGMAHKTQTQSEVKKEN